MIKFRNSTERGLYDFMLGRGYAVNTTVDYIHRLRKIMPLDQLVCENLDNYIDDYTDGAHKDLNRKAHNAFSAALKQLCGYAQRAYVVIP